MGESLKQISLYETGEGREEDLEKQGREKTKASF
jgi:hypothetical protein